MSSKDNTFVVESDTEARENRVIGDRMSVAHWFWSGVCGTHARFGCDVFNVPCASTMSGGARDKQTRWYQCAQWKHQRRVSSDGA